MQHRTVCHRCRSSRALSSRGVDLSDRHQLVAPDVLRSTTPSLLDQEFRAGEFGPEDALNILEGLATMRIRLLGDRVSRAAAWRLAQQLDWDATGGSECVAVAQLQADALITRHEEFAYRARDLLRVAPCQSLASYGDAVRNRLTMALTRDPASVRAPAD